MSEEPKLILEIVRVALPFAAAVAGWFVASRFQDIRERRKEIRALIDEAKKLVDESYALTLEYYSTKNRTPVNALSAEIKLKNMLISQYFIVINQAGLDVRAAPEIIQFTQLSTGGVFETRNHKDRRDDEQWRASFAAATNELRMILDKRYFDSFRLRSLPPRMQIEPKKPLLGLNRIEDESWF